MLPEPHYDNSILNKKGDNSSVNFKLVPKSILLDSFTKMQFLSNRKPTFISFLTFASDIYM